MSEENKTKALWLYMGYEFWNERDGLAHKFQRLDENREKVGKPIYFLKKNMKKGIMPYNCYPGSIFEFGTTFYEDGRVTISFGEKDYKGKWPNTAEAEAMYLASRAEETRAESRSLITKDKADTRAMQTALRPIARQYNALGTIQQKIAFELLLIETLRRYDF